MKKFNVLKLVQLGILTIISLTSVFFLLQEEVRQFVFSSTAATTLFYVVWVVLVASFVFLLLDYRFISSIKLNYHNLYEVAYSDPLSGIPNRFSCDVLIEKYIDKELPDNMGCVMTDLTNLPEINSLYSHKTGNELLKQFSGILTSASVSLCFVGRNGGNKFLAIFEDCTQENLDLFLRRVDERVRQHNNAPDSLPIEYRAGSALNSEEHLSQITKLIALSNHRIYGEN